MLTDIVPAICYSFGKFSYYGDIIVVFLIVYPVTRESSQSVGANELTQKENIYMTPAMELDSPIPVGVRHIEEDKTISELH